MIWLYFYFALIFDKAADQKAVFYYKVNFNKLLYERTVVFKYG